MIFNLIEKSGVSYDSRSSVWSVNNIPALVSLLPSDKECYPSGWVLVSSIIHRKGIGFDAKLTVRTANSDAEYVFDLPVSLKGTLQEVVFFPRNVISIVLQPMSSVGEFRVDQFVIKKISLPERLIRQYIRVLPIYFEHASERVYKSGLRWHTPIFNLQKAYSLAGGFRAYSPVISYENWIERFDKIDHRDDKKIRTAIKNISKREQLNVVVLGSEPVALKLKASLNNQFYNNYRLWTLEEWFVQKQHQKELGWVIFVENDIQLRSHALFWLHFEIINNPDRALIYSDHDFIDDSGLRVDPEFKPQCSPELLFSRNYIGSFLAVNLKFIPSSIRFEDLGIYKVALSVICKTRPYLSDGAEVKHIPAVLYHDKFKSERELEQRSIVKEFIVDQRISATVSEVTGFSKVFYHPVESPLISIIIPTRDMLHHLERCVESVLNNTMYSNFEILILDNQSEKEETISYLRRIVEDCRVKVIPYDHPFNYSAINNFAATKARGDVLCLLNNDTEVISAEWLDVMLGQLQQSNVGAVGVKLLFANRTVQHAGDAVGPGGCADHFHSGIGEDEPGYQSRAIMAQDLSAVTAACLLTSKHTFLQLGGLDELNLAVAFNDVDYCLRVRESGKRVVFTPYAKLFHHESASRGKDDSPEKKARSKREAGYMRQRWSHVIANDPFYNPNLNYSRPDFTLSNSPLIDKPWHKKSGFLWFSS